MSITVQTNFLSICLSQLAFEYPRSGKADPGKRTSATVERSRSLLRMIKKTSLMIFLHRLNARIFISPIVLNRMLELLELLAHSTATR